MSEKQKGTAKRKGKKATAVKKRTNHLLIIGIDEYSNGVPRLNNAVRDAENFRDLLIDKYQFSKKNLTCLFNEEASRANIISTFSDLLEGLTDEDNLIFYYSGHGEQLQKGTGNRGYWIPCDAKLGKDWTYIPNDEITLLFKNSRAHHVFGIVDSCFSGSLFQSRKLTTAEERISSYPSRWLLTAGRLEPVSDGSLGANSPFATALFTYLKNYPDNSFWVSDLCNQVLKGMRFNTTKQTPRGEPLQEVGHYGGQFVFYKEGFIPDETLVDPIIKTPEIPEKEKGLIAEPLAPAADPSTLAELKSQLKVQVSQNLEKAITKFQAALCAGSTKENDIIMLSARYNSNKKQELQGTSSSDQITRSYNQIRFALLSYIEDLEREDVQLSRPTPPLPIASDNPLATLINKKLNKLKAALVLETDAARQFQYEHEIEKLEKQLEQL